MDFNIQIGEETPKDNFATSNQKVKIVDNIGSNKCHPHIRQYLTISTK
jgi:hypothetical protein